MMLPFEIYFCQPDGIKIQTLEIESGTFVLGLNRVGYFSITLPGLLVPSLLRLDAQIHLWIPLADGGKVLAFVGMLRAWERATNETTGLEFMTLAGPDLADLVSTRVVAYYAGSPYSHKTDYADDIVKQVVRENLGVSATASERNIEPLGFTIQGNMSLGPIIEDSFAWQALPRAIEGVCQVAATEGTEILWAILPTGPQACEFGTWVGQRFDRGSDSKDPLVFSVERGNLIAPVVRADYTDESNVILVGGPGEGQERTIATISDLSRIRASRWNRREYFQDARQIKTYDQLEDRGKAALHDRAPKRTITGTIVDAPSSRYGSDWHLGSRVVVSAYGQQYNVIARQIEIIIEASGLQTIQSQIAEVL